MIAYAVAQRRRELGIRMALGAPAATVKRMFLWQGFRLAAAGIALGLVAAAVLSRLMSSLLFGVAPLDPATYGAAAVFLIDGGTGCNLHSRAPGGVDGPDGNASRAILTLERTSRLLREGVPAHAS